MGFKHRAFDPEAVFASMLTPNYLLKIIPHVGGSARICELVRYSPEVTFGTHAFHHPP